MRDRSILPRWNFPNSFFGFIMWCVGFNSIRTCLCCDLIHCMLLCLNHYCLGNAMGYIRMIRSGGLHCCSNAIRYVCVSMCIKCVCACVCVCVCVCVY